MLANGFAVKFLISPRCVRSASCPNSQRVRTIKPLRIEDNPRSSRITGNHFKKSRCNTDIKLFTASINSPCRSAFISSAKSTGALIAPA